MKIVSIFVVSIFVVHRALSDKTYLSLGLLSPLKKCKHKKVYSDESAYTNSQLAKTYFSHVGLKGLLTQ